MSWWTTSGRYYSAELRIRNSLEGKLKDFMSMNRQVVLRFSKINKVLEWYKEWRACEPAPRAVIFSRKVLYYIAERMYWSRFPDSELVVAVLYFINDADKHLTAIMRPNTTKMASLRETPVHEFVGYFLNHAHRQKALFGGYRMACAEVDFYALFHPVLVAVLLADPLLLHQLLRYGGMLSFDCNYLNRYIKRRWSGWRVLSRTIAFIVQFNPKVLPNADLNLSPEELERYKSLVVCCNLLLKDFPQWSPSLLASVVISRGCLMKEKIPAFIQAFSANIVPNFEKHFTSPLDLKESCRLAIRRDLNEKWLLPTEIYNLPIPESLKKYLDLHYD